MNSLRIGIIGLLVEYQGVEAAQGFLHLFEGWVIFVACLAILFGEALLLHKVSGRTESIWDVVAPRVPIREIWPLRPPGGRLQPALIIASAAIFLVTLSSLVITNRSELVPKRLSFLSFPLDLEDWHGHEEELPADVLEALHLDDYVNINFVDDSHGTSVNLYVAYYASQRKGASAHSPKSCIPGGGWEIERISTVKLDGVQTRGFKDMTVNRVIIVKGSSRQLVYYWFQQRGRVVANEYMVKWYIFEDAITRQRTDGAMVRLVTPLGPGEDPKKADAELVQFITRAEPELDLYIPN
jgi:exosortase D (VPLPA-CTERM-specific)